MFARSALAITLALAFVGCSTGGDRAPAASSAFLRFPDGFKWCVATAAYQIEGGNTNADWHDWERFGHVLDHQLAGDGVDHVNRVGEDADLIRALGVRYYRMSIEWSRIFPKQDKIDETAVRFYRREIQELRKRGIEPTVTLQHMTLPKWVARKGGWEWDGIADELGKLAEVAYRRIGPSVRDWYTINEPFANIGGAYVAGSFPPGTKRPFDQLGKPVINMLRAHAAAYHAIHDLAKRLGNDVRVGVAQHLRDIVPANGFNPIDRIAAGASQRLMDWSFLDALETGKLDLEAIGMISVHEKIPGLAGTQDFIGVNYYSGDRVSPDFAAKTMNVKPRGSYRSDIGWEAFPLGLYKVLKETARRYPKKPIVISENGIADARDYMRERFIRDHLFYLHRAISEGVPVEGYCHWSLMDNFEWLSGYKAKFGLYRVDFPSQRRVLRASGKYFADIVRDNGLEASEGEVKNDPLPKPPLPDYPKAAPPAANAVVFEDGKGCRIDFTPISDEDGEAYTEISLTQGGVSTNPAEGNLRVRNRDGAIVAGPQFCQDLFPNTRAAKRPGSLDLVCGGNYDYRKVHLRIEKGLTNRGDWNSWDSIKKIWYEDSVRAGETKSITDDVQAVSDDLSNRVVYWQFDCSHLKRRR